MSESENKKMGDSDLITNLPEDILHHCLSFLETKDAIQTSVLSKEWNSIGRSLPILDFDQVAFEATMVPDDPSFLPEKLTEMFLNYLTSSIQRYRPRKNVKLQRFRVVADLRGLQSGGRLNTALNFAVDCGVKNLELSLSTTENQFSRPPECLYLAKSVTVMKLTNLVVNINDLLKGCPLLEDLRLHQCQIPVDIKVLSAKLKTLEFTKCLGAESISLEAVDLQSFTYCGVFIHQPYQPCEIGITACRSLKSLSVKKTLVGSKWLEDVIPKLLLLETLEFHAWYGLKSFRVYHRRLRSLKLYAHHKVGDFAVAIDTPKLRVFVYHGALVPFAYFNSSGTVEATLNLLELSYPGTTLQFASLRKLLKLFGHCKILRLSCESAKYIIFSNEMRENKVAPLLDLKHLEVHSSSAFVGDIWVSLAELVDSCLWQSPHLEALSIFSGDKQICGLKFEYHEGRDTEELFCCGAYLEGCWKRYLKSVIVQFFHGNSDDAEGLFTYFEKNANACEIKVERM